MTTKTTRAMSSVDRATAYAQAVVDGGIVAGPHVRNACRRHLHDLEHAGGRGFWYDADAAQATIEDFFEGQLKLSEGQFEGRPFALEPSQDFIIGSLFGWKRKDGTRRFRRAFIEMGKGNGKSPLAGGIGLKGLCADGEPGAQIYAAAAQKDQAQILFRDAVKMVRKSPNLAKRIKPSGGLDREYNLAYLKNASFFRPISREAGRTGSGPRPHFALCDEVHEHPDGAIMEMLERGFKFRRQPLLFMITNSGSDRTTVCWEEHEHAVRVAAGNRNAKDADAPFVGDPIDDTTFSYVCALDVDDDPLKDPSCWIKANPLLGVTVTEEYLAGVVAQAKELPSKLNNILRLHFCRWTDAETAWMTRDALEPCIADFDPKDYIGRKAWLGLDLSLARDFTSKAVVVEDGFVEGGPCDGKPKFVAWVETFTPKDTLAARDASDGAQGFYQVWADQGFLTATHGDRVDFRNVAQSVAEDNYDYDIQMLAYDRYAFKSMFEPEMRGLGLEIECVEHPQGGVRKGKPTESMKLAARAAGREPEGLWMPTSKIRMEELILEKRIKILRNPVTISGMMQAEEVPDRWGNTWLGKPKGSKKKIDPAIALGMAIGAAVQGLSSVKLSTPWDDDPNFSLAAL